MERAMADAPPTLRGASAASATPAEWLFLAEWFLILGQANVHVADSDTIRRDSIRIGGEDDGHDGEAGDADAWLEVVLNRWHLANDDAYDSEQDEEDTFHNPWSLTAAVQERVALLRDAIVLTSFVGKVDYAGWLGMMKEFASFSIPKKYTETLGCNPPRIPIQFVLSFGANHNQHFLTWSKCLGRLMGDLHRSAHFVQDLAGIKRELAGRDISWMDVEPTALKLCLGFDTGECSSSDLSARLMQVVDGIHHTERLSNEAAANGVPRAVLFRVVDIDVSCYRATHQDHVIEALTNLLQTGVRVSNFWLPVLDEYAPPNYRVWGPFLRLLTGVEADDEGRLASARCIEVDSTFVRRPHFALLCSALAYAKGVEVLSLRFHRGEDHFGRSETDRSRAWRWLAFALFSKASTTSVAKLSIQGERPVASDLTAIKQIVDSDNPFHLLSVSSARHEVGYPVLDSDFRTTVTTIQPRSIFRVANAVSSSQCVHYKELSGEVLSERNDAGDRVVFVPGYGFCYGQLPDRPHKRKKDAPVKERVVSSCTQLAIGAGDYRTMEPQCFLGLLKIIGTRLQGLKFFLQSDNSLLAGVLELCPNLRSLRPYDLSVVAFDVVRRAYANGSMVSSLCLDVSSASTTDLHEFLSGFLIKYPAEDTPAFHIKRLQMRFGQEHRSNPETVELVEKVLAQNETLTHFIGRRTMYIGAGNQFDGRRIPGLTEDQKAQLVAFLGAMRAVALTKQDLNMDGHVKQLIHEFAASPRFRRVQW